MITDEAIARLRARVGVAEPWTRRPHYFRPNTDTFRIVAEAYGDDNPLFGDPDYATASVWGGPVAPPLAPLGRATRAQPPQRPLERLAGQHARPAWP